MSYKTGFYEGRLGIGLSSTMGMGDGNPRYPLDINGDIRLTGSIVNGDGQVLSLVPAESLWTIGNSNLSYTGGNVGIGTTSPSDLLSIGPGTHVGNGGTTSMVITAPGENSDAILYFSTPWNSDNSNGKKAAIIAEGVGGFSGSKLHFCLDNTSVNSTSYNASISNSRMTILRNGNVGIGTTSPQGQLSLYQSGDNGGELWFGNSDINGSTSKNYGKISFNTYLGGGVPYRHIGHIRCIPYGSNYGGDIIFHTINDIYGGGDRMVIRGNGNVGIGTTSPPVLFTVRSGGDAKMAILAGNDVNASAILYFGTQYQGNVNYAMKAAIIAEAQNHWGKSKLHFCLDNTGNNSATYNASLTNSRMTITQGGNVGIGTTSPGCILEVYDNSPAGHVQDIVHVKNSGGYDMVTLGTSAWYNSGSLSLYINSSGLGGERTIYLDGSTAGVCYFNAGNVGIGTTSPDRKLSVAMPNNTAQDYMGFYRSNSTLFGSFGYNSSFYMFAIENIPIRFGTNNGEKMRILGNGNVGINHTSPTSRLHVQDSVGGNSFTGYRYSSTGPASANNTTSIAVYIYGNLCVYGNIRVGSDRRIKENIVDVPDNLALEMVRKIPCRYYEYRNKINVGSGKTIGFIAQEVKEHFPMAVKTTQKEFLPTKMCELENISWNEIIDASSNFGIGFQLISDLEDVSGQKYKFFVANDLINEAVEKEIIVDSLNRFIFQEKWEYVFCYGKEVDDFHTLDKQKLFALNFSATQELDKKVIALENENAELKAELAAIKQHLGI